MTARNIDDVEHIRRLLAPERAARRPIPAPNRPHIRGTLDGRRFVDYPPEPWGDQRFPVPSGVTDRVRLARARHKAAQLAAQVCDVPVDAIGAHIGDTPLRGMPTPAQRRERTERAVARLAAVGVDPPPARLSALHRMLGYAKVREA